MNKYMNKKMLIKLGIVSLSLIAISGGIVGIVVASQSKGSNIKTSTSNINILSANAMDKSVELNLANLTKYKNKNLILRYKLSSDESYGQSNKVEIFVNSNSENLITKINNLTPNAKYDIKILDGQNVILEKANAFITKEQKEKNIPVDLTIDKITDEKAILKISQLNEHLGKNLKIQYTPEVQATSSESAEWKDLANSNFVVDENNKENKEINLLSSTFKTDHSYIVRVVTSEVESIVLATLNKSFRLPKITLDVQKEKVTFKFHNMDSLNDNLIKLSYKKQSDSEWLQYDPKGFKLSSLKIDSVDKLPIIELGNLSKGSVYDFKITTKNNSGAEFNLFEKIKTFKTPFSLASFKIKDDIKAYSFIVKINNLSDYVGKMVFVKYKKSNDISGRWDVSVSKAINESNKDDEIEIALTNLDPSTEYQVKLSFQDKINTLKEDLIPNDVLTATTKTEVTSAIKTVSMDNSILSFTNLLPEYANKTLVVKYVEKNESQSEQEAIMSNIQVSVESVLPGKIEASTEIEIKLTNLKGSSHYLYKAFLKQGERNLLELQKNYSNLKTKAT